MLDDVGLGADFRKVGAEVALAHHQKHAADFPEGYSHQVVVAETDDIQIDVPDANHIVIKGIDKQKVGQFAADVRAKRPPEPYKGKGIRYDGEFVRIKEGKTGAK